MTSLPSPLFQRDRITTLIGPPDNEMAALVAAIAVSHRTGYPLIPGYVPDGPGEVSAYCYEGDWIGWKCLIANISAAARLTSPVVTLRCLAHPWVDEMAAVKRDPDAAEYWEPYRVADVDRDFAAATAAGHQLSPLLTVIYGLAAAAGPGGYAAIRRLYDNLAGGSVLVAGVEMDVPFAADYGPVIEIPDLHNSVRWRDLLAALTGGDNMPDEDQATVERADVAEMGSPGWGSPGVLFGYCARFNEWREVDSRLEGHYLEQIRPGAFAKAIAESAHRMKVCFEHGKNPDFGYQALGDLTALREDLHGVYYEAQLLDADHTRRLVPGLRDGLYRSSFAFEVVADDLVTRPGVSAHNPRGLPELTVTEVRCSELGPCRHPAYAGTSAGIRLAD